MTVPGIAAVERPGLVLAVLAGLAAAVAAAMLTSPLGPTTMDPDGFASVLYFERIVAGRHLESFVPTTPKPLLTVTYGLLWALTGDWRVPVLLTVAGWGIAAGLVTLLAWRGGGAVTAGFVGVALAGWSALALEVSRANSLVWALAFLAAAALLLRDARPRRGVVAGVGLLLLLAGTSRVEGLLATAALGGALVLIWLAGVVRRRWAGDGHRRRRPPALRWWPAVPIGALALPAMLVHDWLLTGDPWFWVSVASRYTAIYAAGLEPLPPLEYLSVVVERMEPLALLVVLAAIGAAGLLRRRDWAIAGGLAVLSLGVLAMLSVLAARGVYISNRYYEPVELAIIGGAGLGLAYALAAATRLLGRRPLGERASVTSLAVAVAVGAIVAVAIRWPLTPWDERADRLAADVRRSAVNLDHFAGTFAEVLASAPAPPDGAFEAVGAPERDQRDSTLLVSSRSASRVVVEQGSTLLDVGDLYAAILAAGTPEEMLPGPTVLHDSNVDRPRERFEFLEVSSPTSIGGLELVPLEVDAEAGAWLLEIRDAR